MPLLTCGALRENGGRGRSPAYAETILMLFTTKLCESRRRGDFGGLGYRAAFARQTSTGRNPCTSDVIEAADARGVRAMRYVRPNRLRRAAGARARCLPAPGGQRAASSSGSSGTLRGTGTSGGS